PHASSHGLSGAELIRLPLNALMSNQKDNCNAKKDRRFKLSFKAPERLWRIVLCIRVTFRRQDQLSTTSRHALCPRA
ncbi:hypothetical protein, partial [Bradyrhizobium sp. LA2.1]|uniref:hypothetical protein n=1 Tax=Bradyrhizobium sp. LA2.1 TaxID=3156376 RepID=UPI00339B7257